MDMQSLRALLVEAEIPERAFRIGDVGHADNDVYCLERAERSTSQWVTYYYERGGHFDVHSFDTEDAACRHFAEKMLDLKKRGAFG